MTWADWVIIVLLVVTTFGGFRQGFVLQLATIFGALAALAVAKREYPDVRQLFAQIAPHSVWLTVIAYLAVFLVVWMAIVLLARRIRWLLRRLMLGWADRVGGAVVGFLQGLLVTELLVYFGKRVPNGGIHHAVSHAVLTPLFVNALPYLRQLFPHITV